MKRQREFQVFIIELLSRTELMRGKCDANLLAEALHLAEVPYTIRVAQNEKALDRELEQAARTWEDRRLTPVLHLSSHGNVNKRGLVLANRRCLEWEDLACKLEHFKCISQGT